jgi:hypothetical protein
LPKSRKLPVGVSHWRLRSYTVLGSHSDTDFFAPDSFQTDFFKSGFFQQGPTKPCCCRAHAQPSSKQVLAALRHGGKAEQEAQRSINSKSCAERFVFFQMDTPEIKRCCEQRFACPTCLCHGVQSSGSVSTILPSLPISINCNRHQDR